MAYERVASLEDLPVGEALRVEVGGEPLCLVRVRERTVKAVHDRCSHEEYPLSEGWVGSNDIECSLHGSTFDLDTGQPTTLPATRPVPVYACTVRDGDILVDPERQLNDAPVPRY